MNSHLGDTLVRPVPLRILVVDDDVSSGALVVRLLQGAGYAADHVLKPESVVPLLRDGEYSLVLLDQTMPGMDGLTVLEKIRKENQVPVVMLTGADKSELAVRAIRLGAFDYLTKPVDEQRLLDTVRQVLEQGSRSGDRINRYQIEGEIGRGGMGVVYLARDPQLDRRVALKVLLPEIAADPAYELKFLAEARHAAKFSHPNIVTVYEAGRYRGQLFIAMEFVKGEPLETLVRSGTPVSPAKVYGIGIQVAAALEAMHAEGMIHGDLKPANLIMTGGSTIKVLDFGLVRPMGPISQEGDDYAGTLSYAPPEALDNGKLDARGDLYALGVVLYELLTGLRAFESRSMFDLMHRILEGRLPKPISEIEEIPQEGRDLLSRLVALKPEDRFATVADARSVLIKLRRSVGDPGSFTGRL